MYIIAGVFVFLCAVAVGFACMRSSQFSRMLEANKSKQEPPR